MKKLIEEFLEQKKIALVGIARDGKGFGNLVFKELKAKGYQLYPVHPETREIGGHPCWPNILQLPAKVGGVVTVVPPPETEKVVRDVVQAGIPRVWMQQGSESPASIRYCEEHDVRVVHGHCILMFAEPAGLFHKTHRWFLQLLRRLPR